MIGRNISFDLRVLQVSPVQYGEQAQLNPLTSSIHNPEFIHGLLLHSSISVSKQETNGGLKTVEGKTILKASLNKLFSISMQDILYLNARWCVNPTIALAAFQTRLFRSWTRQQQHLIHLQNAFFRNERMYLPSWHNGPSHPSAQSHVKLSPMADSVHNPAFLQGALSHRPTSEIIHSKKAYGI